MFIIITPETTSSNEVELLKTFVAFEHVQVHIRKPKATEEIMRNYLQGLPEEVLRRSCLHSCHQLACEFGLRGVHFTTSQREKVGKKLEEEIKYWHSQDKQVSTSFHSLEEITSLWNYAFLSPIFDSVSKQNYKGKRFSVKEYKEKLIALGGITESTIKEARILGYQGVAVLGNVWQSTNPMESFKAMYVEYNQYFL